MTAPDETAAFLVDLHCHSYPRSACSSLRPEEVVDLARERGLDGVCFTEHDRHWDAGDLADLRSCTRFAVFAGVELTTDVGHILAYGLPSRTGPLPTLTAVCEAAKEAGALLFLAHPARDGLLKLTRELRAALSSIESVNGSDSPLHDATGAGLARRFALPGIGGSDAHTAAEAGRAATRLAVPISDTPGLLEALRSGAYTAVRLH